MVTAGGAAGTGIPAAPGVSPCWRMRRGAKSNVVLVDDGRPVLRAECRLCGYAGPFDSDDVDGGW